jgi:hypothetical protein
VPEPVRDTWLQDYWTHYEAQLPEQRRQLESAVCDYGRTTPDTNLGLQGCWQTDKIGDLLHAWPAAVERPDPQRTLAAPNMVQLKRYMLAFEGDALSFARGNHD